ncbi:hypothetical protein GUJ93_ZPchr0001g31610 [Zizania palustris]|uniref:Uncharacterized protein n=1 Tax=Zizania palustris TaxID=103762 RepID=A0A8J5VLC4_ZIZPA|nr:hypothetical protein GUJ93_ZPchr0001g31610 [Zizania palustris]
MKSSATSPRSTTFTAAGEGPSGSPATEDPVLVGVRDDSVPLEGVIQFDKPGNSSTESKLASYAKLGLLANGDVLCLLVFSAIGRFSHGLVAFDPETFKTVDPFIAGQENSTAGFSVPTSLVDLEMMQKVSTVWGKLSLLLPNHGLLVYYNDTYLYVASGVIYGGEETLRSLRDLFLNFYTKVLAGRRRYMGHKRTYRPNVKKLIYF